ncbi:hypothetical protein [Flavobacterium sp.]|uniref:hypothetical protein n=1 Tax=Flavobacterium sp. TaxID=239 RepID=UPI00374CEC3E
MKTTNRGISTQKMVSVVLTIALLSCLGFSYKIYGDSLITKNILQHEKIAIMNDLRKSKDSLELAISENSNLKTDLIVERQKVTNLMNEISTATVDVGSMMKYKNEVSKLKSLVASLSRDKVQLKMSYDLVKIQRDSTILVLTNANNYKEKLAEMNENLNKTIKKGAKISVINLKTTPLKQARNGGLVITDKASSVNVLQISFMVVGNKMTKSCDKKYYVQIIDSKNNIVGEKKSISFDEKILDYSFESPVKFNNETMEIVAELNMENVAKGTYFVNVFDKNELASKGTFALR